MTEFYENLWNKLCEYYEDKYKIDDISTNAKSNSISFEKFSQTFRIVRKMDSDDKIPQLEIWTLLAGVNESNKEKCEKIAEEYKNSIMLCTCKTKQYYLQISISVDKNTTMKSIDKVLKELCKVIGKIEEKISEGAIK